MVNEAIMLEAYSEEVRRSLDYAEFDQMSEINDGGLTIHVFETSNGNEHLRFDCFSDRPHYHYIFGDEYHINVAFDSVANGDMFHWVLQCFRTGRLRSMLAETGDGGTLVSRVNDDRVRDAVAAIEARFAKTDSLDVVG
jgi:hypothetical protein